MPHTSLYEDNQAKCQVLIVGDKEIGKSAITTCFAQDKVVEIESLFIYRQRQYKNLDVDNKTVRFTIGEATEDCIREPNGDSRRNFEEMAIHSRNNVILLTFDMTFPHTLENVIEKWYPLFSTGDFYHRNPNAIFVLVGTKADKDYLVDKKTRGQAQAFADEKNISYCEVSAKNKPSIVNLFICVARDFLKSIGNHFTNAKSSALQPSNTSTSKPPASSFWSNLFCCSFSEENEKLLSASTNNNSR